MSLWMPAEPDAHSSSADPPLVRKTLFLVRHGEAVHNIEEAKAKSRAASEASSEGHSPSSNAFKERLEAARRSVLQNGQLLDAELSADGKLQALRAKMEIESLTALGNTGLPWPTAVLTSPLQRTLQTTALIFPGHPGVHIRECLRERRTGLPCDERQPALQIRSRPSFAFMSSFNLVALDATGASSAEDEIGHIDELEDRAAVRRRTTQLVDLLRDFQEDAAICVVTHKGFLRELERGPLGRTEATEFGNCEVRVYEVAITESGKFTSELLYSAFEQ